MDVDTENYILLLLADGNLPTGSFVASSGLESYVKHGFFPSSSSDPSRGGTEKTLDFIRYSLESYSHSALPFVLDAHILVYQAFGPESSLQSIENCQKMIPKLDMLYNAMTLNHVTRRASKAQGVALLTLFSKGFGRPNWLVSEDNDIGRPALSTFIDHLKLDIRRDATHGHLPICWGVLTAALGISAERSQYLHLFLHARGLLSAAIRINVIGPYAAQQLLLHAIRPLVDSQMVRCKDIHTGLSLYKGTTDQLQTQEGLEMTANSPANTWPLGEILAARHDLQHSRIFNS